LICEQSSAHIEQNTISSNLKSNIALGACQDTQIINNQIENSTDSGIFMYNSSKIIVRDNTISFNNDGIVDYISDNLISYNKISNNKSNGIIFNSKSIIYENEINYNEGIGIFIRGT
jgi:parallel beta-helix repeat protein